MTSPGRVQSMPDPSASEMFVSDGTHEEDLVVDFLCRVYVAASKLTNISEHSSSENLSQFLSEKDLGNLLDKIAGSLLEAASPEHLVMPVDSLPSLLEEAGDMLVSVGIEEEDDEEDDMQQSDDNNFFYQNRRTDYLRLLLRLMAPISMQVASLICEKVISHQKQFPEESAGPAFFLLFSHWLPVAPHLTPMAIDVLCTLNDPWKGCDQTSDTLFLFAEASYKLCLFFSDRGQINIINSIWNWTFLFDLLQPVDTEMSDTDSDKVLSAFSRFSPSALKWYAARSLSKLLDWKPQAMLSVLERLGVESQHVSWEPHQWALEREEMGIETTQFQGKARLWGSEPFCVPSVEIANSILPPSPYLTRIAGGILFYKHDSLDALYKNGKNGLVKSSPPKKALIPTSTTCKNLALLGAALCQEPYPPPIMVCGPHGSGKSSLIREMLRLCRPADSLLEFHIDEETDAKTLIGSYTTTDVPGEFAWRPGALTHATRMGRWVLFEDIDGVPTEIQAAIVMLLEDRVLPLGNGKFEKCHPEFRIFGTCTTSNSQNETRSSLRFGANRGAGKRILSRSLWRKIHVLPLPFSELKEIALSLYSEIPGSIVDCSLSLMQTLDRSGRTETNNSNPIKDEDKEFNSTEIGMESPEASLWAGGREPSVRDFFKLLSRISTCVKFETQVSYTTEAQRTLCMAESVDIFVGSCPDITKKHDFIRLVAAPKWGISRDLAMTYIERRRPETQVGSEFVEIGRVKIHIGRHSEFSRRPSETFAPTNYALRLMESVGVCVQQNEPVLLVGETGCGKTSIIQQLAAQCERELIVQNLSLQTDSTDLLGGYRPLELKNVARRIYQDFVDLFVSTFSRKQNAKFLQFAASVLEKKEWKKLSHCFHRAAKLGTSKMKEKLSNEKNPSVKTFDLKESWARFKKGAAKFERQVLSCDAGLAFIFAEGALVEAIQSGKWVLLDEINLASSDTLQRLCGLLDEPSGSVTLTERGDATEIPRHPNFRLFAAMNPATDSGKKDIPPSIRSRFSELYVDELVDPVELRVVAARYLESVLPVDGKPAEHKDIVITTIEVYLKCRDLSETVLSDGAGHKPRYTLRTLSRALTAARTLVLEQRFPLMRALYEGFQLAFEGALDSASVKAVKKVLKSLLGERFKKSDLEHPGRRPGGKGDVNHILLKPFWIEKGPEDPIDWSEASSNGKSRFILTPTMANSLRRISRALASGPWPLLLEGPTSAGKTTLVEYIAARCGHHVVRINNHEHTDVQEYTGSFAADNNGRLCFRDGLLVRALRRGHWVILDELNLAPSEVLEALNRLLDDNRELYLAETNETVKPHRNFRLFATQNPSGAYGGRKPLSRAFRNRFVEVHMGDIPSDEMITILEKRCGCPPSHAKRLVDIMVSLRYQRSKSNVFLGKDSFITPRDLLRWAERRCTTKMELAEQGFMLLAERLRTIEEKAMVQAVLEEHLKVKLDMENLYYGENSESKRLLNEVLQSSELSNDSFVASIAPSKSLLRLISLVMTCIEQKEPVLLVGDTGCGKTTVVQFLSLVLRKKLFSVNCHATTETSDLLGGLRPIRGRDIIQKRIRNKLLHLIHSWPYPRQLEDLHLPQGFTPQEIVLADLPSLDDECDDDHDTREFENAYSLENMPDVEKMVSLAHEILKSKPQSSDGSQKQKKLERTKKRRKLSPTSSSSISSDEENMDEEANGDSLRYLVDEIDQLARRYASLFEWFDGPLVNAMKEGQMLLLDEMSLAEDAVLERLNSVLEPSRTLVLAEKGDDGSTEESRIVVANDEFRVFATMNPGGDFGKRELSPALRSRFTEIWVPAISDRDDFKLVLGRTLEPRNKDGLGLLLTPLVSKMLEYVDWFNTSVCGEKASPFAGNSLSLRDVLSWARFIVETSQNNTQLEMWDAYVHGVSLMHLDGLGLGSGLALEDVAAVRQRAENFLSSQVPKGVMISTSSEKSAFAVKEGKYFGCAPFFIPVGRFDRPRSHFNMGAPTTAINTFRVLRAMQLRKPVLLEGSPGVGKTSLITALAEASGNKLVRINLSEQTDISDLMGSDLPVQSSKGGGASFEWCDGVLLTAIKEGSWVLLDELNLASQSVLEGLNSCLDHRATVFIPEIGKTFHCPQTFRVFGAQNPLGQGGGRKGLPKSFLNRFTKVYVDGLNASDLRAIVNSQYPSFDINEVKKMTAFNSTVSADVVDKREYGSEGAPWEFNLRDIFRWSELLQTGCSSIQSCARTIYFQRFRNRNDRERVEATFNRFFKVSMKPKSAPIFQISRLTIQVGDTVLPRLETSHGNRRNPLYQGPELYLSRLDLLEAIARCVALKWPCLLIGPSGSGKTALVTSLAELCNMTLVEQSLSPSSDVTELLGCFEQVESKGFEFQISSEVCELVDDYFFLQALQPDSCRGLWDLAKKLEGCIASDVESIDVSSVISLSSSLCGQLMAEAEKSSSLPNSFLEKVEAAYSKIQGESSIEHHSDDDAGHFVWRDGILVEAMTHGYWLVLQNVNLCPASVLDRLNSVLEKNGELLLSECGTLDDKGSSSHRRICPHPNFRVFLSMNPTNGEVSRAMRNRCVELYLPHPIGSETKETPNGSEFQLMGANRVDMMGLLHGHGIRSLELASTLVDFYVEEHESSVRLGEELPSLRGATAASSMLASMLARGIAGKTAMADFSQVAYELDSDQARTRMNEKNLEHMSSGKLISLPTGGPIRNLWLQGSQSAKIEWEARILKFFQDSHPSLISRLESQVLHIPESDARVVSCIRTIDSVLSKAHLHIDFCNPSLKTYLFGNLGQNFDERIHFFTGFRSSFAALLHWMSAAAGKYLSMLRQKGKCTQQPRNLTFDQDFIQADLSVLRDRLEQMYLLDRWRDQIKNRVESIDSPLNITVMEASYLINESALDRTKISCPVTPFLYPFLLAVDKLLDCMLAHNIQSGAKDSQSPSPILLSKERDQFWTLLRSKSLSMKKNSFLGFDEAEFLVAWKRLKAVLSFGHVVLSEKAEAQRKNVHKLVTIIDDAIFGDSKISWATQAVRLELMQVHVPREANHWKHMMDFRRLAKKCSLVDEIAFVPFSNAPACVNLNDMVDQRHPLLYIDKKFRVQLLSAFSTKHAFWTDEVVIDETARLISLQSIDFEEELSKLLDGQRNEFETMLSRSKVDVGISTVENQLSIEMLEKLDPSGNFAEISNYSFNTLTCRLMSSFVDVQISPLRENWSLIQESRIVGEICEALVRSTDDDDLHLRLKKILEPLEQFIESCLSSVVWSVTDLRPYQTLKWIIETWKRGNEAFRKSVRSLLTPIIASKNSHVWANSFNRMSSVSMDLEMPKMWIDDEVSTPNTNKTAVCLQDSHFGTHRICHQVRSEFILHTVGKQLLLQKTGRGTKFYTVENSEFRLSQYREILKSLSSVVVDDSKADFWLLLYVCIDLVAAIKKAFDCPGLNDLLHILNEPVLLDRADLRRLAPIVETTGNEKILYETYHSLVLPLVESLQVAYKSDSYSYQYRENTALACVYLGLIRLTFVTPDSPLDPGEAPIAEVRLIDQKLVRLRAELSVQILHSGYTLGDFNPRSSETADLSDEGEYLLKERFSQQLKVVKRPSTAASYYELFRISRDFVDNISPTNVVVEFANSLVTGNEGAMIKRKVKNWQQTSAAFCEQIHNEFSEYEDVTMPLVDSIRMIQDGLQTLSNGVNCPLQVSTEVQLFQELVRFPIVNHTRTLDLILKAIPRLDSFNAKVVEKTDFLFGITAAALTRLLFKQRLVGLRCVGIAQCRSIIDYLLLLQPEVIEETNNNDKIEDIDEKRYREQFPDHRKEFNEMFEDEEDEEDEDQSLDDEAGDESEINDFSNAQLELISSVLYDIFAGRSNPISDVMRKLVYHCSYNAASSFEALFNCTRQAMNNTEHMSGHTFAMALTVLPRTNTARPFSHLHRESTLIDFQNEPNPVEVITAKKPLFHLMARSTQLLTAFPGHPILLGIVRVCDKVSKFDVMTVPIGKVMTGLEVVLRQAQEWEQHASDRVRLGGPLKDTARLVAKWRKLELESWPHLILARKHRFQEKARKHFLRLQAILADVSTSSLYRAVVNSSDVKTKPARVPTTPRWVWKGFGASGTLSTSLEQCNGDYLISFTKTLDTFVLTASLGEFSERLRMLRTCAIQLSLECGISTDTGYKQQQARALNSIHAYYLQFEPALTSKLEAMLQPIQRKLKDEVKLAKWDEQTYYALAESTEKNHRKLMKILAEVDDCLGLNAGQLIQAETIKGIRMSIDSNEEISSSVPSNASIFPDLSGIVEEEIVCSTPIEVPAASSREWTNSSRLNSPEGHHIHRIQKYATKMELIEKRVNVEKKDWASIGGMLSTDICEAIFERIVALRAKSTRPMKERALVDLFRELKRNGFTTTKWATPNEMRSMEEIFQLPSPNVQSDLLGIRMKEELKRAEKYYQRCICEYSTYASESKLLGSKHLGKREVDMMLALAESGMLMIVQQRCLVSIVLEESSTLKQRISSISYRNTNLPLQQLFLDGLVGKFEENYLSVVEGLRQVVLLFKLSQPILEGAEKTEWARDAICQLERCIQELEDGRCPTRDSGMITWEHLLEIENGSKRLTKARQTVRTCKEANRTTLSLPGDCFDIVLSEIENAIALTEELKTQKIMREGSSDMDCLVDSLKDSIERSLISFQHLVQDQKTDLVNGTSIDGESTSSELWKCHKELLKTWNSIDLHALNKAIDEVSTQLKTLHDVRKNSPEEARECAVGLASDVAVLAKHVAVQSNRLIENSTIFFANTAKLQYVLLRVFRVLVAKGYCSDETADEDGSDADGDVNGMTFEDDQDGTGMGEGDGKKDVTDQLENEDQLAGLKAEKENNNDNDEQQESRQLNEDEADQGMEMEQDFEGEMCDLPDKPQDDEVDDDDGEELDREMGEDASPDEQVVDERMWNDSDDEDDINKEEEKFEKDNEVEGEAIEGATRTKEEDEGDDNKQNRQDEEAANKPEQESGQDGGEDDVSDINEDSEDRYEEKHGVDVNKEENEDPNAEDGMNLDDDLNLDDGGDDDDEMPGDEGENVDVEEDENLDDAMDANDGGADVDMEQEENNDEEDDGVDIGTTPSGVADPMHEDEDTPDADEPDEGAEENQVDVQNPQESQQEAHGIRSNDGTDAVMEEGDEKEEETSQDENEAAGDTTGSAQADQSKSSSQGGAGLGESEGAIDEMTEKTQDDRTDEAPNPFKDPGDASKFWHRKLNVIDTSPEEEEIDEQMEQGQDDSQQENQSGDFEYTSHNQENSTQVLGEATEEEAVELTREEHKSAENDEMDMKNEQEEERKMKEGEKKVSERKKSMKSKSTDQMEVESERKADPIQNEEPEASKEEGKDETDSQSSDRDFDGDDNMLTGNQVVSDLSRLTVEGGDGADPKSAMIEDEEVHRISRVAAEEARSRWLQIQGETFNLSRRLCEKLRLVMEPLVASKLRGDYRSGKRINMKRVIGYIASGCRRDKIWLRRTKPAKRDYRVLLAVDDSESMKKSGAGETALRALATLAVGMNQLEIGEVGIASFGEDMKLLHPFHLPFTSESGASIVTNFQFDQQRTRTALCVESAIASLDAMGDHSSMQLVFLISDGRIERDSRNTLKRLIREMMERNILLAMIVVEGEQKKKDSIVNMKEVTFEKGKPVVKRFIEDYPFPYYIILDDMVALPEVLGDALRQWFEMLAQLQSPR